MKSRTIHIVVATTLFAILLWFSLSMSEQYQIQVTAPLVVRDLPPGKAIVSALPRAVRLTFNDSGWRLAKATWGSGVEWVIDLNAMPSRQYALTLRDVADQLGGRLGIKPISMYPDSLYVSLDTVATKRVAVDAQYSLTFRDGFGQVGPPVVRPESVTVTGAQRVLQQIRAWPTARQAFELLRQDLDATVPMSDSIPSLVFEPEHVHLHIPVQQIAEKTFPSVTIEVLSVPPNREVMLSSPRIDVVVRGGIEQLAMLQHNSIRALVDYRDILADTSGVIEPEISVPPDIRVVKKSPERLQYVVRKK